MSCRWWVTFAAGGCWPAWSWWRIGTAGTPLPSVRGRFAEAFTAAALEEGLVVWPNVGQADGVNGDLVMLAPPFVITEEEIDELVSSLGAALTRDRRSGWERT